ncbi:hypothetical protein [Wohlfahrtiimonas sp. G9077]|uniref:hypothetical protein n=1 Tax=Wohlfahrtiimonas sp. G9077 TaxID=1980118 RepID=UPI000B97DBEC|nr:hypothetical protein [Wohlfahrtiimonas sp. G9077]OYQ73841.1 hypothetical protein B9T20_05615 [Wohlfahrtiimonas sp. G9077]
MSQQKTTVFYNRDYQVRHEWLWSKYNRQLDKVGTLRITLIHPTALDMPTRIEAWLSHIGATQDGDNTYYMGGCGLAIVSRSPQVMILELCSGGQDILDALEWYAQTLSEQVIEPDEAILTRWEELPLYD